MNAPCPVCEQSPCVLTKRAFTVEAIRRAFWAEYHKSGEHFFRYFDDSGEPGTKAAEREAEDSTASAWTCGMLEKLHEIAGERWKCTRCEQCVTAAGGHAESCDCKGYDGAPLPTEQERREIPHRGAFDF